MVFVLNNLFQQFILHKPTTVLKKSYGQCMSRLLVKRVNQLELANPHLNKEKASALP